MIWGLNNWTLRSADQVAGKEYSDYKAATQGFWVLGAVLGSFAGAQLAAWLGRRVSYCLISLAAVTLTWTMFLLTAPLRPKFHVIVFAQGLASTLFFGWLAFNLPVLFPTHVRSTGSGLAYDSGRFATAAGVLLAGFLFTALGVIMRASERSAPWFMHWVWLSSGLHQIQKVSYEPC